MGQIKKKSLFFLKRNKKFKKNLFSYLVQRKRKNEKQKKEKQKKPRGFLKDRQKKDKKKIQIIKKKSFSLNDEKEKKHRENTIIQQVNLYIKKRFLWLKKRFYSCLCIKPWHRIFQRFRSYRFFYKNYTEATLYERMYLGKARIGELLRVGSFPMKPTHFEFCYRRCEGVLLCTPQKWYNLSLLYSRTL